MALVQKQFGDLITFTRSSAGGRFNERGIYEMVPANQPRFNYDPATLQPLGILSEESRTNLITSSNEIGAVGWATSASSKIDKGVISSPDGLTNGARLSGTGEFYIYRVVDISASRPTFTISVYAKQVKPGDAIRLRLFEGGGAQPSASQTSPNIALTDKWTRYEFTATVQQPDRTSVQLILLGNTTGSGSEAYFWGAQMEIGASATSLITTQSSQVTRTADVVAISQLSPWYNPAGGTLFVDYTPGQIGIGSTNAGAYLCSANPSENVIVLRDGPVKGTIYGLMALSAQEVVSSIIGARLGAGVPLKMAYSYSAESAALSVNGAAPVKGVTGKIAAPTRMFIGGAPNTQQLSNGHVRAVRYYPFKLTDAELQALTK